MKLKDGSYKSHWNILLFCDQWKMMSDFNISHEKMSDFVSFPLFKFNLVIKPKKFSFEIYWNISSFFDKNCYDVRFEYVDGKMSDFVLFLLLGFTLVIKLIESHWNTLILSIKKINNVRLECILSNCVLFDLSFIASEELWW